MHDAVDVALALRCEIETHKPFLDKESFHVSYRNGSPARLDVMRDPRTILARGGMTLRELFAHVTVYQRPKQDMLVWCLRVYRSVERLNRSPRLRFRGILLDGSRRVVKRGEFSVFSVSSVT